MADSQKAFYSISETADIIDVPQHVLRFWETKFSQIRPVKRAGNRRYYRQKDISLIQNIKELLYTDGYTIRGVQKILKSNGDSAKINDQKKKRNSRKSTEPINNHQLSFGLEPCASEGQNAISQPDINHKADSIYQVEMFPELRPLPTQVTVDDRQHDSSTMICKSNTSVPPAPESSENHISEDFAFSGNGGHLSMSKLSMDNNHSSKPKIEPIVEASKPVEQPAASISADKLNKLKSIKNELGSIRDVLSGLRQAKPSE